MISRRGICYDLNLSDYRETINGITYVFSSQNHLDKFKRNLNKHRETINTSLSKRFNLTIDVPQLADVVLYKKIETRGFLIVTDEGIKLCQNNILYGGENPTLKRLNE
ncbi:MAG: hypothetical protein J6S23_02715 [Clostridia bacterium]|nr:hypothetical protein [Clostridia bacterium]